MKNLKHFIYSLTLLLAMGVLTSCDEDAPEHIAVTFAGPFGASITEGESANFRVVFSRPTINNSTVLLKFNSDVATYGTNFTTSPQAFVAGELRLDVPAGSTSASFSINTIDDGNFSNGYQIEVVADELTGDFFSTVGTNLTLEISDPPTAIYNLDDCSNSIPSPFIQVNESGSNPNAWICTSFGNTGSAAEYNAFSSNSSNPSDAWLILDLNSVQKSTGANVDNATLSSLLVDLWVYSRFSGNGTLSFHYSQDYSGSGDPSAATWTKVESFDTQLPAGGSRVWTKVSVDASGVTGSANGYIAVRHTGGIGGSSSNWRVDDVSVFAGE